MQVVVCLKNLFENMHSIKVFSHCWKISHGQAEAIYSWQIANNANGKFNDISVISGLLLLLNSFM